MQDESVERVDQVPKTGEVVGEVVIGSRFNGPVGSANGGYACGVFAEVLGGAASVRLRMPPPLEVRMRLVADGAGGAAVLSGEAVVAEVAPISGVDLEPPVRPSAADAEVARQAHPWVGVEHPLSHCFVCGPSRSDGLGMSHGALAAAPHVGAAPWVPDASVCVDGVVRPEVVWAALDCPSYPVTTWKSGAFCVLGTLAAQRHREIRQGERLVAVGWPGEVSGRLHRSHSVLLDEGGDVVAAARAVWVQIGQV